MRIAALFLVMLLEVIGFLASYNHVFRHASLDDRILVGCNFIGVILLALVVLYDERYFVRHYPRGARGEQGIQGVRGPKGDTERNGLP